MTGAGPAPATSVSAAVRTTCPYCGVGCGVLATADAQGGASIAGDPAHPANLGRLCVKGAALGETLGLDNRLLYPQQRAADGALQPIDWPHAVDEIARRFADAIREHGPDSVAFYVSGQLLTEDYYVANKLMKGYLGSANIDTNSRLCMSSAVAAHKRTFGEDYVPVSYADLELADLVVLVGSNTAWCHPVIWQRIIAARKRRPQLKIVVIDPRRTATADEADLHLPLAPGTDVWLFNGLLHYLQHSGRLTEQLSAQLADAAAADGADPAQVAERCGLPLSQLLGFYALWADTERVVTAFSQGVNQSSAGTDKATAIINCHLLTGRWDRPGMGPFSITGQPNAMGGREVGGLSNQLAAHLDLDQAAHRALVQAHWGSPMIADRPGLKAVDLFTAVGQGRIKALWIMATNPVVSLPDADAVREALRVCPFVVVSDVVARTDTSELAHLLLPAAAWGEKDGTVTNSERCISRQRAFLPLPGEARADWWALCQVAKAMGFAGFDYHHPRQIFDEHCALTAKHNHAAAGGIPRRLNLAGLTGLSAAEYDQLPPQRWPVLAGAAGNHQWPVAPRPVSARPPHHAPDAEYPWVLNTGRVRDHWHTMTRTGLSPRLATHVSEPCAELHADDAAALHWQDGDLALIESRWGRCLLRASPGERVARGQLFAPIHWNGQTAAAARIGAVVNPVVDPLSGEPEFKHTPARLSLLRPRWHGVVLSVSAFDWSAALHRPDYWVRLQGRGYLHYELAGLDAVEPWLDRLRAQWLAPQAEWLQAVDAAQGQYRAAWLLDGRWAGVIHLARQRDQLPPRSWLGGQMGQAPDSTAARLALLAGRAPGQCEDPGPTVCSCFGVGRNTIVNAIVQHADRSVEALGARLRCGSNCGSCIPELNVLLQAHALAASH